MPNSRNDSLMAPDGHPAGASTTAGTQRYGRVIDAHMHWYPQAFVDLMIKKGPTYGAVMGEDKDGPVVVSVPGATQKSSMRRTMTNVDSIMAAMDNRRVNANVLSMGARIIGTEVARACLRAFLEGEFTGGRHVARVEKIARIEAEEARG